MNTTLPINVLSAIQRDIQQELVLYGIMETEAEYLVDCLNSSIESASGLLYTEIQREVAMNKYYCSTPYIYAISALTAATELTGQCYSTQVSDIDLWRDWWINHRHVHNDQLIYMEPSSNSTVTVKNEVRSVTSSNSLYICTLECSVLKCELFTGGGAGRDINKSNIAAVPNDTSLTDISGITDSNGTDDLPNAIPIHIPTPICIESHVLYDIYPISVSVSVDIPPLTGAPNPAPNPTESIYKYSISGCTLLKLLRMYVTHGGGSNFHQVDVGVDADVDLSGSMSSIDILCINQHWVSYASTCMYVYIYVLYMQLYFQLLNEIYILNYIPIYIFVCVV